MANIVSGHLELTVKFSQLAPSVRCRTECARACV
jgi:hypothetical protein